mgnify:CR=1 FL=1
MYTLAYDEVLLEAPSEARAREREAIQRSIDLMLRAEAAGVRSREAIVAVNFVQNLWSILIRDLASSGNTLEPMLRANLISIGLSLMRQSEDVRHERSDSFSGLIEISKLILEGLR